MLPDALHCKLSAAMRPWRDVPPPSLLRILNMHCFECLQILYIIVVVRPKMMLLLDLQIILHFLGTITLLDVLQILLHFPA